MCYNEFKTKQEEEYSINCNNTNSSNENTCEDYTLNSSEFNTLYLIKRKENNNNSSNQINNIDNKIIQFKTENYPLNNQLEKKLKKENSLEKKNLRYFKKPRKSNKKKQHTASDDDNILRKIQVIFLSFIISYTNDIISSLINENVPRFKDLSYEIKKIVNHKFVESLKSKKIEDIVKLKITPKIKKDEKINQHIYDSILKICPIIKEFFDRTYLSLFEEYYENQNNNFTFNGKIISLSGKTIKKTYNSLINKNFRYKEKIKYVCINYYLNTYKRIKKPNFKIYPYRKLNQNKK